MQHLQFAKDQISESEAMDLIFRACRSNENRNKWTTLNRKFSVSFTLLADGSHEAVLKNDEGVNIAIAVVDQFDC